MSRLLFKLEATQTGSRARATRFKTLHNEVLTPTFMPVGTHANVRNQHFEVLENVGAQVLLANTYHLHLKPGPEFFKKFGGIHKFTSWKKSFLTDSGGFQIFCMPQDRKITEEGATFKSYINGDQIFLSPEQSIETQKAIGSDIMMVLDECVPSTVEHTRAKEAMELTHRWALRSLAARKDSPQSIFGIIQGACYRDLRKTSAKFLTEHPFDGFAIGGLAVGETKDEREEFTAFCTELMPQDLPRYLMGVGTPIDLLEAVHRGVDMFDCIIPTAHAEQGLAYTFDGKLKLYRGAYKLSEDPIDKNCKCSTCSRYSKAFLHHLFKSHEHTGSHLVGVHNLHFYQVLMRQMREAILEGKFMELYSDLQPRLVQEDPEFPSVHPVRKRRPERAHELGSFELTQNPAGQYLIKCKDSGETMHSVNNPNKEADELYTSLFREALVRNPEKKTWTIWDVGLGAGHNAMSLLHFCQSHPNWGDESFPKINLISFEKDLDAIRLVLMHPGYFPHIRHAAPHSILESKHFAAGSLEWNLYEGDFWSIVSDQRFSENSSKPDIIFWDPFSSETNQNFWNEEAFAKIYSMASSECSLSTYSTSTWQRIQLLLAGWNVYEGPSSGPKNSTTRASITPIQQWQTQLLKQDFLKKVERSQQDNPRFFEQIKAENGLDRLFKHPQFSL